MSQQVSIAYATTDYKMFKRLPGNRKINRSKLEKLIEAIRECNLLEDNPIIVDQDMNILDGQHRLEAAKVLCLPIYYKVSVNMKPRHIRIVNGWQNVWRLEDFLSSYVELGNDEYKYLEEFINEYNIHLSDAINLCHYPNGDGPAGLRRKFTEGEYIANNLGFARQVATALVEDFKPFLPKHYCQRVFVHAIVHLMSDPRYDHERMKLKLVDVGYKLHPRVSTKDYFPILNEIYNRRVRADEVLEFTFRKPARKKVTA
jgi:hypothetical protein